MTGAKVTQCRCFITAGWHFYILTRGKNRTVGAPWLFSLHSCLALARILLKKNNI